MWSSPGHQQRDQEQRLVWFIPAEHKGGLALGFHGSHPWASPHWPSAGRLAWGPEPASCGLPGESLGGC